MAKNNLQTYLDLCTEYYDLDKSTVPPDALSFYMHYVRNAHGPILEPMCGTGRFLIPILEAGFEIDGFDASSHMLQALETKCKSKQLKPTVWQQFLQDMDIKKQYALIFIPSGSFSLIIDPAEVKLSLERIFKHLRPGGVFVFEVETLQSISDQVGLWHGSMRRRPDGSMIVVSSLPLESIDNVGSSLVRYDLIDKGAVLKTEVEYFQVRFYTIARMTKLLRETGFKSIRLLRPYDLQADASDQDQSIVFECVK